ncbi:MAG: glycosyltransferase, partial [Chloroflexota bacterium]
MRAVSALGLAARRRTRARVAVARFHLVEQARATAETRPFVADLTWRPVRRVRGAVAAQLAERREAPVRRDPDAAARPYFDATWYAATYGPTHPEAATDPWGHYRAMGAAAGLAPNPVFDVATYRWDHPDVADHGGDALRHWVLAGRRAGATPHPLFDAAFYARTAPDLGGMDPYLHYLTVGRAAGRAASAAVDPGTDIATVTAALPEPDRERVAIVIPAYGNLALVLRCLVALGARTPLELGARVHLSDDDPSRPLAPVLAGIPGLALRANPENLGFLRNCNAAVAELDPSVEHVVLLNTDTVVEPGWLDALLAVAAETPDTGMVGARLIGPDGRLQEAGVIMDRDAEGMPVGRGDDPERPAYRCVRDVDAVSGSCVLIPLDAWRAVGGFDEAYAPAYFEEYDLAFRLRRAGRRIRYAPGCRVHHAGNASYAVAARDAQVRRNRATFQQRFAAELATQPARPVDPFLARQRPSEGGIALVVDDRVPEADRHAGALFTRQHLALLGDLGIRVVYAPDDGVLREPAAAELERAGIEVLAPGVDLAAWLIDHGRALDWVWLARPHIADRWLPLVRRWTDARVVYYTHDLHFLRERRRAEVTGDARAAADAAHVEAMETRVLRGVDAILTPSAAELAPIAAIAPGTPVAVLGPYVTGAAGEGSARAAPPLAERHAVMFLGGFEHLPNVDAAILLVREVMPRVWAAVPDAEALIVGSDPTPEVLALAGDRVTVTGWVPDLAPWFARSRMTLSALRYGSGLKGKIVASLEAGVPVVT